MAQVPLLFLAVFKRKSVKLPACAKKVPKYCRTVDLDFIKTTHTDCTETLEKDEIFRHFSLPRFLLASLDDL